MSDSPQNAAAQASSAATAAATAAKNMTAAQRHQLAVKQEVDSVRAVLERMKTQFALALPKHVTPERLLRVTMTAVQNTPKLLECDRTSLFAAVMTAAQLGLEPDGVLGQAYLVPFAGKVQFIVGYKGYLTLARNSGEIETIQAHEVCKGDEFEYAYGLREELRHRVLDPDRSWSNITHFYAYATYKSGGHVFEVMTRAQVEAIRNNSQGYKAWKAGTIKTNPWDPEQPSAVQMGRKTVIRRIANYLPLSVQRAAALDAAYDAGHAAKANEYGDVVIDGESTNITDQPTGDPASQAQIAAATKLDALAGGTDNVPAEQKPRRGRKPKAAPAPESPPATNGTGLGAAAPPPAQDELTAGKLTAAILNAKNADEVDSHVDLARGLASEDERAQVLRTAEQRKKQLGGGLFQE